MGCSQAATKILSIPSYNDPQQQNCQAGYYWDGSRCRLNQATQNIYAFDCTFNHPELYSGCFAACWGSPPAGTDTVEVWHVNPETGLGTEALLTGISPSKNTASRCGLYPGGILHWNVRAYSNGNLIGYSNVVRTICLG
jgi:hypothetical protein